MENNYPIENEWSIHDIIKSKHSIFLIDETDILAKNNHEIQFFQQDELKNIDIKNTDISVSDKICVEKKSLNYIEPVLNVWLKQYTDGYVIVNNINEHDKIFFDVIKKYHSLFSMKNIEVVFFTNNY